MLYEIKKIEFGPSAGIHAPLRYQQSRRVTEEFLLTRKELWPWIEQTEKYISRESEADIKAQIAAGNFHGIVKPYGITGVYFEVIQINRFRTEYLGYEIINTGNSDGFVLRRDGALWETHLGNYGTLDRAKQFAIVHYMIARPDKFASVIASMVMTGRGLVCEYDRLDKALKEEGRLMPPEISATKDTNRLILYRGEHINA